MPFTSREINSLNFYEKAEEAILETAKKLGYKTKISDETKIHDTDDFGRFSGYSKTTITIKLKKWFLPIMKLEFDKKYPEDMVIYYGLPHGFSREETAEKYLDALVEISNQ